MELLENHPRTVAKVISWRVMLTISHIINGFVVSGSWVTGLQIAGLAAIINSVLYWLHERSWNRAQWNRKPGNTNMFVDGQPRTISKSITWRLVSLALMKGRNNPLFNLPRCSASREVSFTLYHVNASPM